MPALQLDHIGFLTASLEHSIAAWRRLGFSVTSPRVLWQTAGAETVPRSLGQSSAHVMFNRTYLEITAINDADPAHHLAPWRSAVEAPAILALAAAEPLTVQQGLRAAGHAVSAPGVALRQIEYGAHRGEARFEWFMWQRHESPEWLVCVLRHLTPELVFQSAVQEHANGALELSEVYQSVGAAPSAGLRFASDALNSLRPDWAHGNQLVMTNWTPKSKYRSRVASVTKVPEIRPASRIRRRAPSIVA